ncbi:MAG: isoprenylcysteine carboxylmethyltransferase family protein [archaeon]|nr:isoprenylcysteine carboxylmethyltransferase family protein [archaeon]MCP8313450.1 isoprenylcysteine carboxylmethyltransferase family protein [archaeon]MCP8316522.1 isoprenylcysteine carboxylmethyltransferase family protein [archaeon]MCP8320858.1 isoprenylcysteine carboxylmethyltransferase family protein [archaeon]
MSLVPEFELGLWNAWIFMLYFPLHPLLFLLIDKVVGMGDIMKKMATPIYTKNEKRIWYGFFLILVLAFIYSVFLPLQLGMAWFYVGLPIYLVGLLIFIVAIVNIATTPHGEPFTKGAYRYSRHPMYLGQILIIIGVTIASASWVFLLLSIALMILSHLVAIPEERLCLESYGDAYRKYMNRTPKWIGIPKSSK